MPAREARKTVTVFFCDVSGSTALGERIDPESLRHVLARYFETARAILERHGGTVEKFIGDAVMAVFGVPVVREDDALRALRAASELRDELVGLNDELERAYGTRLELRIGINTGEVVTGTEERIATGDAVNVAARLEQAARPGEILVGGDTLRIVHRFVEVEPVEPVVAKGKAAPVSAARLVAVRSDTAARPDGGPMVGRDRQRKLLEDVFAHVVGESACQLFTVLGSAGIGKSRLVAEFTRALDAAEVVRGRCPSYGEGSGQQPVVDVVRELLPDGAVSGSLASLGAVLGEGSVAAAPDEIARAYRKLLELRAADRPLVVVFEDVHWGSAAFLDLVEHVADLSRGAPILLLCIGRPELLDHRPTWGGGKLNATNVLLEPLTDEESHDLIDSLALAEGFAAGLRERILESAAGNPLFVEEMVAMAAELGRDDIAVPPTIHALLAARIDQLDETERAVLERGAVEGRVFHRGAVVSLLPGDVHVGAAVDALVRKDLIRPESPAIPGDEAYRFRHLLLRDTAYEALPKAVRADMHELLADWLGSHADELAEPDGLLGHHLGQACRYRFELGPADGRTHALAERAAGHLLAGGERARSRGEGDAAATLLRGAIELFPSESAARRAAQVDLAVVLADRGEFELAAGLRAEAEAAARAAGDGRVLARSALAAVEAGVHSSPGATMHDTVKVAERVLAELERFGDDDGIAWALRVAGVGRAWLGDAAAGEQLLERSLQLAEQTSLRGVNEVRVWIIWLLWLGTASTEECIRRCDELLRDVTSARVEATALLIRGNSRAARGQVEEGRADAAAGRAVFLELGDRIWWAGGAALPADIELWHGQPELAYELLSEAHGVLAEATQTGYLATTVGWRAQAALACGRDDEALDLAVEAERLAAADDFEPQARQRLVQSRVQARRGGFVAADELLREAAALIAPSDYADMHIDLAFARADVARLAVRPTEARLALERAIVVAGEKGHLVALERARQRLTAL